MKRKVIVDERKIDQGQIVTANNQCLDGLYFHSLPVCHGLSPNPSKAICNISSGQSASKTRPHIVMAGAVF